MSAIAGVLSANAASGRLRLERIHQALAHRGNHERVVAEGAIGVACRAWQEATREQGLFWGPVGVVADAALYNHEELARTLEAPPPSTDAELIARAYARWGTGCLEHLDGDFAFALWDAAKQRLFCARDPLGVRPFFYRWDGKSLAWASEVKALAADPEYSAAPDEAMVAEYVLMWSHFPDTSATFYRNVRQVPGGHFLTVENGQLRVERYWDVDPAGEARYRRSFEENVEEFRELLRRAVFRRSRSPNGLAVEISGGLDSTSVGSLIEKSRGNSSQASPRYLSFYVQQEEGDERRHLQSFEETYGTRVEYLELGEVEVLEGLEGLPDLTETPFLDLAWRHTLQLGTRLSQLQCGVVLTGLGGDNMFPDAGPSYFLTLAQQRGWRKAWQTFRVTCARYDLPTKILLVPTAISLVPGWARRTLKRWLRREVPDWVRPEFAQRSGLLERVRRPLPTRGFSTSPAEEDYRELTSGRLGLMLAAYDRHSALHPFEFRHPFFDPALVRFTILAPLEHKVRDGETKLLLRESMRGILPEPVRLRLKKGTAQPFLVEGIRRREAIRWKQAARGLRLCRDYVKPAEVESQVQRFLAGDDNALRPAWRLLSLEFWLQKSFGG